MRKYFRYRKWYKIIKESGLFDIKYYLFTYPDVREKGIDPIKHYILFGADEGRNPSAGFDTKFYLDANPDVVEAGVNPLVHYILNGRSEKRNVLCVAHQENAYDNNAISRSIKYIHGDSEKITKKDICLFAHYDKDDLIDDYVLDYLKKLNSLGADIIFITVCDKITKDELEKLTNVVAFTIVRKNIGYDFGSWRVGFEYLKKKNISFETLLFVNDSVYAFGNNLKNIYNEMQEKKYDMWGMTDSYFNSYHLQSYFLVFNRRILNSREFNDFMLSIKPLMDKMALIKSYEIGLSVLMAKSFSIGSYVSIDSVIKFMSQKPFYYKYKNSIERKEINVTHFAWDVLIKMYSFPFVKIELLRDNPLKMSISDFCSIVENDTVCNYINKHLKRTKYTMKNKVSGFNILNLSSESGTKKNKTIVVLGSARGGTSMVAGLLRIMGVNMGDNLDNDTNEDEEFLFTTQPIEDLYNIKSANHNHIKEKLLRLIERKNKNNTVWGWKDPQSIVYFDKIDKYLINPHCIVIYRDPLAIAQKEINDGIHGNIIKTLNLIISHRFKNLLSTTEYIEKKKYPLLMISYERSIRDKKNMINTLSRFLNINIDQDTYNRCLDYISPDRNSGDINL